VAHWSSGVNCDAAVAVSFTSNREWLKLAAEVHLDHLLDAAGCSATQYCYKIADRSAAFLKNLVVIHK